VTILDPKGGSEFGNLENSPHLRYPIAKDGLTSVQTMNKVIDDMNDRYTKFDELRRKSGEPIRNLNDYNNIAEKYSMNRIPRNIVFNDEISALRESLKGKKALSDFDNKMKQLAMKGRASGVHLIAATQKPTEDNLPKSLSANTYNIALATSNANESRNIIDESGAEKLLGQGDGLLKDPRTGKYIRFQSAYTSKPEEQYILRSIGA
jgi:S-DNA-T family DNA segregation ATPase FtsK/SpoIIIE